MAKKKGKKKTKSVTYNEVDITYAEYTSNSGKKGPRVKISVNPIRIPVYKSGEQVRWNFNAKGTAAICRITFKPTSPFNTPNPSPYFGPGVGPGDPSNFESGPLATGNTGNYKYAIEI